MKWAGRFIGGQGKFLQVWRRPSPVPREKRVLGRVKEGTQTHTPKSKSKGKFIKEGVTLHRQSGLGRE